MYGVLQEIKSFVKSSPVVRDNVIFWLHYRVTVILLVGWSVIICTRQYYGEPIHCSPSSDKELYSQVMVDTYCWTHSTFTNEGAHGKLNSMYPGVDPGDNHTPMVSHGYYQWVTFMLCFQAILFYGPHLLWKGLECNRLQGLIQDLKKELLKEEDADLQCEILADHLVNSRFSRNTVYVYFFFFCEFLNFLNDLIQFYLTDAFLGGEFTTYGLQMIQLFQNKPGSRFDPVLKVFPLMTKCLFKKSGPGGNIEEFAILCLLPLNIVNQKFYLIFWFWIVVLTCSSALVIIYRAGLVFFSRLRYCALRTYHRLIDPDTLNAVILNMDVGDWFVLFLLGENIDPNHFRNLINKVEVKLKESSNNNNEKRSHVKSSMGAGGNESANEEP